jgi:hypothetical protein
MSVTELDHLRKAAALGTTTTTVAPTASNNATQSPHGPVTPHPHQDEINARHRPPAVEVLFGKEVDEMEDITASKLKTIINALPKALQRKSRLIISKIGDKIKLNEQERVVYKSGNIGSNLMDLLQWSTSSPAIARNLETPMDGPEFIHLLSTSSVPPSCFAGQKMYLQEPPSGSEEDEGYVDRRKRQPSVGDSSKKNRAWLIL